MQWKKQQLKHQKNHQQIHTCQQTVFSSAPNDNLNSIRIFKISRFKLLIALLLLK